MTRSMLCAFAWLVLALSSAAPSSPTLGMQLTTAPVAAQQSDVQLQVQTERGKIQFQIGEIIPLKLTFTSSALKKYQLNLATYDRSGRMNYEKFLVEPEGGWSDPLEAYFASGAYMGGGLTGFRFLSQEPITISLDLNEWIRFDRPGKYSLRIVSHRVGALTEDKSFTGTGEELSSNELQLTIIPASKSWQEATLKKAVSMLDGSKSPNEKTVPAPDQAKQRQAALKVLRYLGTAESAKELARRFRGEDSQNDFECMFGLIGSPYHDVALSEMQRLLNDPDHPVSSTFLYALTVLMRNPEQSRERFFEEDKKIREIINRELLDAVSQKRGKALAFTLNTVLEMGSYDQQGNPKPVSGELASQIANIFDQLPIEKKVQILEYKWDLIKGPGFLPILRKYAQQYRDFPVPNEENAYNSLHLSGAALLHWYEVEPDEARAVIIQEIIRPKPRYTARILGILPDKTLPEVEQQLADHFVKEQNSYAAENLASLLQRYATASVLPQVLPVVDKNVGKWACAIQAPILAYLLRVSPDVARERIEAAMAARGKGYSACNHSLLIDLGALQPDPILEEIAVHSLDDVDPEVAGNAATFLGMYGSPAAEKSLWEHLVLWNEKWRGREKELRYVPGEENPLLWHGNLGANLIKALANGKSWLADEVKLRRLRQLAIVSNTQQEVDSMIAGWEKKPWGVTYFRTGNQQYFRVLQYEMHSLKSFEEKLAQFGTGSNFTWVGNGRPDSEDEKKTFKEVSDFLTNRGIKLSGPEN